MAVQVFLLPRVHRRGQLGKEQEQEQEIEEKNPKKNNVGSTKQIC